MVRVIQFHQVFSRSGQIRPDPPGRLRHGPIDRRDPGIKGHPTVAKTAGRGFGQDAQMVADSPSGLSQGSAMEDPFARQRDLVRQHPENELARYSLGRALFDSGRLMEAREHLEAALRRKPDWMVVQILLGKCDLAEGFLDSARSSFERALQLAREQHHEGPEAELLELLSGLNPRP